MGQDSHTKISFSLHSQLELETIDVRGMKGDVNADGEVNVGDIVTTTNILHKRVLLCISGLRHIMTRIIFH